MSGVGSDQDPRSLGIGPPEDLAGANAEARTVVARQGAALPTAVIALFVALLGFGAFMWMNGQRSKQASLLTTPAATAKDERVAAPEPLPAPVPAPAPAFTIPAPQFSINNNIPPAAPLALPAPSLAPAADSDQRRRAPALVVDLGGGGSAAEPAKAADAAATGAKPGPPETAETAAAAGGLGAEERFAERLGNGQAERVRATQMRNLDLTVPQGAVIPGVLETAINSDLPGFARAVVSRDVSGFDGTKVLIPRGSRLIGQYKSGLALGQSRVFVIWTRVIRPDGVSVQIGSPGTDALGRGGLTGDVDRHFFTRFGGSILLSVVNAGLAALTQQNSGSQIYIGSPADASSVAAVALQKDQGAPPTVKTPQGAPIRIFVARDLDFSTVQPVVVSK